MWHFISEQISNQIDCDFICDDTREITAGDSHRAYRISDGRKRFFTKVNDQDCLAIFETEAESLAHLRQANLFKVPVVICTGIVSDKSFLVLEYLNLTEGAESSWYDFGCQLATMHRDHTQQMFGWQEDTYIGLTIQPNCWMKKWSQFFAEQRIGYMLQLLAEKGHQLANIDKVVNSVQNLLAGHNPAASMLHGDLWSGNTGFYKQKPVLFDPAFYYGDRETDIAMSELFHRFPNAFYQGYHSQWPLDQHYQYRKSVYQLYHILNHALLFGASYLESAKAMLKNLD